MSWTKIKLKYQGVRHIEEIESNKRITTVNMIDSLVRLTGILSYSSDHLVHWLANIATSCYLTALVLQIIEIFMSNGDPGRLFECFSILSFCSMGVLKLISLRLFHSRWRRLLQQIASLEEKQLNVSGFVTPDENIDVVHSINTYTKQFSKTSKILTRLYSFTGAIFVLSPFIELFVRQYRGVELDWYPHILPVWAPLDEISFVGFLATVLCETIASIYCVCVHIAFDLTAIGTMIFVSGQFRMLRDFSERIGGTGSMLHLSKKRDENSHIKIVECHRTHICLIDSIKKLDELLQNILGVYFLVATLTICSVVIRMISEDMSVMQLLSLLQYMCGVLTQLFLFCRYGDAVLNQSSINMGEGPFVSAYWCLSPSIRREIMILGANMMRPRTLHAGPLISLDLPSFIQVVRAAYSCYAVLGNKK